MKNSISTARQSKSMASDRTVTSRSGKSSGTVSKSRKSALKKGLASYGAFNCILPALTILLISMGMIPGKKNLLMLENYQLINSGYSAGHAEYSGNPANALSIAYEDNQAIMIKSEVDCSIRYCGETGRSHSTNKSNSLKFVYDKHSFNASGMESAYDQMEEQSDSDDEKKDWNISISAALPITPGDVRLLFE